MRRVNLLLLLLLPLCVGAQSLESSIDQLLAAPAAQRAVWGIQAVDLPTGRILYQRNAGIPLAPASNTKLFSTALGLVRLGPEYRFETRILAAQQPDAAGRVAGDLVLAGGGDPTLSARTIPYQKGPVQGDPLAPLAELADQLVRAGVRVIEGDLIGDDTRWPWAPYPDGWTADDAIWEYGAPVSALTLNDNAIRLTIRPPRKAGDAAEITLSPAVDHFTIHNTVRVASGAERKITVDRLPGSRVLLVGGSTPPATGAATELIAVDDPALFAAEALAQLLRERGVVLQGAVRAAHRLAGRAAVAPPGVVLASRQSPPLSETLRVINKVSQNLHAEIVLREVGLVRQGEGSAAAAQKEMTEFLTSLGVDKLDYSLVDGSGLARSTLIAPAAITTLLRYLHQGDFGDMFEATLPIGGEDGTLASRFHGVRTASAVHAKTGSISHVAALSGYTRDSNNTRRVAFSIVVNSFTAHTSEVRAILDKIAVVIQQEGTR